MLDISTENRFFAVRTFLDCIPCFLNQALRAGRMATDDETVLKELLDRAGCRIKEMRLDQTPPEMALSVYEDIRTVTGIDDPFRKAKEEHIAEALSLYPALERRVRVSSDPLLTAVRIAIAGNVIDLGACRKFDLEKDVDAVLEKKFAIFHMEEFREALNSAENILYLGDNAGESVFDKLLIETMGKPVTYAVRHRAVINDVTMRDALASGLGDSATLVSSGSPAPATVLHLCSRDFLDVFDGADMIISKGQGNYEALSETERPLFFLLMAKCPVIAGDIGVEVDDIILKYALKS